MADQSVKFARDSIDIARLQDNLKDKTYWRHRTPEGDIVEVTGLSYDGDFKEVVVQFRHMWNHLDNLSLSQRKSNFLRAYERVEQISRWEPARG